MVPSNVDDNPYAYGFNAANDKALQNIEKRNKQIETYIKETQYITDWKNQNNPCDNCPDKDKNWNDKVHLCNLYYVHNCPKLNDFHNKVSEMYKLYRENKEKK